MHDLNLLSAAYLKVVLCRPNAIQASMPSSNLDWDIVYPQQHIQVIRRVFGDRHAYNTEKVRTNIHRPCRESIVFSWFMYHISTRIIQYRSTLVIT